jgi:hypothetical protein
MSRSNTRRHRSQVHTLRTQFAQADGLPLANLLPPRRLERALWEEGACWREGVFSPVLTLWAFLTQLVSADGSCRAAVARVMAWLVGQGHCPCSPNTDPYCKARRRLPESLLGRLTRETGRELHQRVLPEWRWHGRRVKVADGTTVSMPDTAANQAAYPQHATQAPGLGFPVARMVVVFCLACGAALDAALGRYQGAGTGEAALLRGLGGSLGPGDVLVADRQFGGWFDVLWWQEHGVDVVIRLHQTRSADFRCGRRLGSGDHVIRWPRPNRPDWVSAEEARAAPAELVVREVRVRHPHRGFRTRELVVVTTLVDPVAYPARDVGELYRARWNAELDLRSLKVTLGMGVLRCKSPGMVRKEVWGHLLGYNLIRGVMAEAAAGGEILPRTLSFAGAAQVVTAFAGVTLGAKPSRVGEVYAALLRAVRAHRVGNRPNRVEPRARKRRPKEYPHLHQTREVARRVLCSGRCGFGT